MGLKHYRVQYLADAMLDPTAQPVVGLVGHYRHELLITAHHRREVIQAVMDKGGVVLEVAELKQRRWFRPDRASRQYKLKFLQALSFNVNSGLSPEKALEQVIRGETGPQRILLNRTLEALEQGHGFVDSLALTQWFDESVLAMMRAGEVSGQLPSSLGMAVQLFGKQSHTLKLMFGAVSWTMLDILMAVSTVIGMRFGLIEQLKDTPLLGADSGKADEFARALAWAESINNGLLVVAFLFTVGIVYLAMMVLSPDKNIRQQGYSLLERLPSLGNLLKSTGLGTTSRVLSALLRAGVQMLPGLYIAQHATQTPSVNRFWLEVINRLEVGEPAQQVFSHPYLSSPERLLLRAHRDQSQLSESLDMIAESREEMAEAAAKRFAVWAFLLSLGYSGIAVLSSLFVVYLQNETVLSGAA